MAPNQSKMLATIDAGLKAAKASGVQQVVATMWFDDGAEVPFSAAWYGLQAFATYQYYEDVTPAMIDTEYAMIQGENATFYRLLDQFDNFTSKVNVDADNVSKLILYEDLMLQRYRSNLAVIDVEAHYLDLMTKLDQVHVHQENQLMVTFYKQLARTVLVKQRALKVVVALVDSDVTKLRADSARAAVTSCQHALEQLLRDFRALWQQQRRGNGFEVIDVRLGGQIARCETVTWRIDEWLAGRDDLAELREPLLPMDKRNNGLVGHGLYKEIVSACELSF
ncbi:hypothetical protein [Lactiplantibacillus plantarum]|uniref:hypothetical protein n=1 Tax=Lactiplantibacillus plantarum TaxID=1590 RepID=UPI004045CEB5